MPTGLDCAAWARRLNLIQGSCWVCTLVYMELGMAGTYGSHIESVRERVLHNVGNKRIVFLQVTMVDLETCFYNRIKIYSMDKTNEIIQK